MPGENNKNFKLTYALSLLTQIGVFISVVAILFVLAGNYFDDKYGTSPLFLLIALALSLVVNAYGVYKFLKPLMENDGDKRK